MRRTASVVVAAIVAVTMGLTANGAGAAEAHPPPTSVPGPVAKGNPAFTADVLAPLHVTDWAAFDADLAKVKAYGVQAVSVDVWWGDVEGKADNQFDWTYYDRIFGDITKAGLEIAPIFSFHQCGGNVGDDYTSLLPSWLWPKYADRTVNGIKLGLDGLKIKSEQGHYSPETVQGWADQVVANEYVDFTRAFTAHYGRTYANEVTEINVSLGPSGELRYPSYNSHDVGTGYPTRGGLQSYSALAVQDFQRATLEKYRTLERVNAAWGTAYTSTAQIAPPANADTFFKDGTYRLKQYGKDFVDWYNGSLVDHGKRMLDTVIGALGRNFPAADIGYKVPGIHWLVGSPDTPRATEVTTGLIQTSVDTDSPRTGHGYARIIDLANQVKAKSGPVHRTVVMYFTALEMGDNDVAPAYSLAKTLVGWIGQYAYSRRVPLKGENALQGGVQYDYGWDQINDAFDTWGYLGLTVLRMGDVATGTGAARYAQFIAKYAPRR